jgi:hypothetical protein
MLHVLVMLLLLLLLLLLPRQPGGDCRLVYTDPTATAAGRKYGCKTFKLCQLPLPTFSRCGYACCSRGT